MTPTGRRAWPAARAHEVGAQRDRRPPLLGRAARGRPARARMASIPGACAAGTAARTRRRCRDVGHRPGADTRRPSHAAAAARARPGVRAAAGAVRAATTCSTSAGSAARRGCASCSRRRGRRRAVGARAARHRPARDTLRERARQLGLGTRVRFAPYVRDRHELARVLRRRALRGPPRGVRDLRPGGARGGRLRRPGGHRAAHALGVAARRSRRDASAPGTPSELLQRDRARPLPRPDPCAARAAGAAQQLGRGAVRRARRPRASSSRPRVTVRTRTAPVASRSRSTTSSRGRSADARDPRAGCCARGIPRVTLLVIPARRPATRSAPRAGAARLAARPGRRAATRSPSTGSTHKRRVPRRWPRRVLAGWQGGRRGRVPGPRADEDRAPRRRRHGGCSRSSSSTRAASSLPATRTPAPCAGCSPSSFDWFADVRGDPRPPQDAAALAGAVPGQLDARSSARLSPTWSCAPRAPACRA